MTTVDSFTSAGETEVPRDRWKRPLVVPPGGGKPKPYTRCTTFVDCLEDRYRLELWQQRMVALGLADRPDLLLSVSAHRHDRKELDAITERARAAAAAGAAATTGTAEHALCEQIDRGQRLGVIPAAYQADLDAYRAATAPLRMVEIESFSVCDDLAVGGTPDRIAEFNGDYIVADLKTGSIEYGALKIAMQLAVYAHSRPYDPATQQRVPRPYTVDTERAIVIHLPAGQGHCELYWVDIAAGWLAVQVAAEVRAWRRRTGWFTPFRPTTPPDLATAIATAPTVEKLRALWSVAINDGTWTDEHLIAAQARKQQLEGHHAA